MITTKDFYVVLPSNACPDIHPENTAAKFFVSWESPIDLSDGKWKVALTEANFNRPSASVNTNFGIEYGKTRVSTFSHTCNIAIYEVKGKPTATVGWCRPEKFPEPVNPPHDSWQLPRTWLDDKRHLYLELDHPFDMTFSDRESATKAGFKQYKYRAGLRANGKYEIRSDLPAPQPDEKDKAARNILFTHTSNPFVTTHVKYVSELKNIEDHAELMSYLVKNFSDAIRGVSFVVSSSGSTTKKLKFKLRSDVTKLKLLNGFNIILGFRHQELTIESGKEWIEADFPLNLNGGITNMYIYSNVCEPILVGGVRAPLLKSLWLDPGKQSEKLGEIFNISIKYPMYINVNQSSINTIETNIRSDSGGLIPFIEGSVTSLTLHFKQIN